MEPSFENALRQCRGRGGTETGGGARRASVTTVFAGSELQTGAPLAHCPGKELIETANLELILSYRFRVGSAAPLCREFLLGRWMVARSAGDFVFFLLP